jgi:hypothetical protein
LIELLNKEAKVIWYGYFNIRWSWKWKT